MDNLGYYFQASWKRRLRISELAFADLELRHYPFDLSVVVVVVELG